MHILEWEELLVVIFLDKILHNMFAYLNIFNGAGLLK